MNWRDLLYFSTGERRALSILLGIVISGGALLFIHDIGRETVVSEPAYIVHPENAPVPIKIDTSAQVSNPVQNPVRTEKRQQQTTKKKNNYPNKRPYTPYPKTEKYPAGTIVELNTADTTILKKVPGIGSVYAKRIVERRNRLGGFYDVSQLMEVFGMDEERYHSLLPWFHADPSFIAQLPVNRLPADSLLRHPYLRYNQSKAIRQLRRQKGRLAGWENLRLLEEFTTEDRQRLAHYLSFD